MIAVRESEPRSKRQRRPHTPEERQANSNRVMLQWQDPEIRRKRIQGLIGHPVTPLFREVSSLTHKGIPLSEEHKRKLSEAKGGIKNTAMPLLKRGLIARDVALILDTDEKPIVDVQTNARRKGEIPISSVESRAKDRANFERMKKDREFAQRKSDAVALAQKLYRAGFFSGDLQNWKQLTEMFEDAGRELPVFDEEKLILEALIAARQKFDSGHPIALMNYNVAKKQLPAYVEKGLLKPFEDLISEQVRKEAIERFSAEKYQFLYTTANQLTKSDAMANKIAHAAMEALRDLSIPVPSTYKDIVKFVQSLIASGVVERFSETEQPKVQQEKSYKGSAWGGDRNRRVSNMIAALESNKD